MYQTVSKLGIALVISYLWNEFANPNGLSIHTYAFFFMAVFFAILVWMGYLRLDGMRIPRIKFDFLKPLKKKPLRTYADMSDHTDEEIITFADLDDDEKDLCRMVTSLICAIIFLVLSFL